MPHIVSTQYLSIIINMIEPHYSLDLGCSMAREDEYEKSGLDHSHSSYGNGSDVHVGFSKFFRIDFFRIIK